MAFCVIVLIWGLILFVCEIRFLLKNILTIQKEFARIKLKPVTNRRMLEKMSVNIYDVARKAGVSSATVSEFEWAATCAWEVTKKRVMNHHQ